jgi:hypothetical protein
MGVCWQSTGDSSSKPKCGSNRLTNNLIISSQLNNNNNNQNNNTNNNHQDCNHKENLEKKIGKINNIDNPDSTLFDLSFEESVKNFPDMPEIEPQIMKGYGIKQMPGYKCDLKIDQLNKKRDEFWSSKNKLNITKWKIIHQACIYDHINAEEFLFKNNIKTLNGCINMCLDEEGKLYRVPNFCINDPTFQLELLKNENSKKEKINIILNDVSAQKRKNYNIYDTTTGKELIEMYCNEENIEKDKYTFKLIFGGGIIKDDETLFQHKVKNDYVIQICKYEI